ncbi:MAG: 4'-phosphopantetheinyl transferase superfamily protein [Paracoccaceae bacterium]
MPDLARLTALARGLVPAQAAIAAADPGQTYPLLPGEVLPNAVPSRRAEFSAGRYAARVAMAALGLPLRAIPMGDDRAPIWPAGLVGSISHCRGACLAAVMPGAAGLGLDLEGDDDLPADLWDSILLPAERDWVQRQTQPGAAAKLIFSAKEAAYKAQYAQSRTLFGFYALQITVSATSFVASFQREIAPYSAGARLAGRWARAEGLVLTIAQG